MAQRPVSRKPAGQDWWRPPTDNSHTCRHASTSSDGDYLTRDMDAAARCAPPPTPPVMSGAASNAATWDIGLPCGGAWFAFCGLWARPAHTWRDEARRPLRGHSGLGALALAGAGVFVFLVVLVITARPGGHPANAVELAIQILVVAGAVLLVAGRIVRRS